MSETDSSKSRNTGSSRTTKDSSTVATTINASDHNDAATVVASTVSGQEPSNPETASRIESEDSTTDSKAYDNAPRLLLNGGEHSSWGSEVIEKREEPWSGVSPRPSFSNLRDQVDDTKQAQTGDQQNGGKDG